MARLSDRVNIGNVLEQQLESVGISSLEALTDVGSKAAWLRIQHIDPSACLSRLSALEGAILGVRWHTLDPAIRADLKAFYQQHRVHGEDKPDFLELAQRGEHPLVLAEMESGFAVLANTQFLPGYCILLASPRVNSLNALPLPARMTFLRDMTLIGEAIEAIGPAGLRRINYEILGNTDPYLHAHIIPRYDHESEVLRSKPAFLYPPDRWTDPTWQYDETAHGELRAALERELKQRIAEHA